MYPSFQRSATARIVLVGIASLSALASSCSTHRQARVQEHTQQVEQVATRGRQQSEQQAHLRHDSLTFDLTETLDSFSSGRDSSASAPLHQVRHLRGYLSQHHRSHDSTLQITHLQDSLQQRLLSQTKDVTPPPALQGSFFTPFVIGCGCGFLLLLALGRYDLIHLLR